MQMRRAARNARTLRSLRTGTFKSSNKTKNKIEVKTQTLITEISWAHSLAIMDIDGACQLGS